MSELSPAELIALAGAVKDKALTEAKRSLADGSSHSVDFGVRISGSLQKGVSTPSVEVEVDPTVNLSSPNAFFALLRSFGIGAKRLRTALASLPSPAELENDEEFKACVEDEQNQRVKRLPKVKQTTSGRQGTVQSQIMASRV